VNSLRRAKRFAFPLLGLWLLLYASFFVIKPPLVDGPDAVNAEAAREMAVTGDWIMPHINGIRSPQTPPLLIWVTAISFRIFGVSDRAARVPMTLAALALFAVILALGSRLFLTPVAGFYAALILITSCGIFLFGHLLFPSVLLTLWLTLAMYFFWRSLRHPTWQTSVGFGAACALGFLSIGATGLVFPMGIVLVFLFYTNRLQHLVHWKPAAGIVVFLLTVLPWFIAAFRVTPAQRFIAPLYRVHKTPVLVFLALALIWITPWFLFSLAALGRLSGRLFARGANLDHNEQALLLLVIWAALVIVLLTFSSRQEYFTLPALPALSLLAAGWLAHDEHAPSSFARTIAWILFVVGVIKAIAFIVLAFIAPRPRPGTDIATLLHLHPGQHQLFFGYFFDLTRVSMAAFRVPLLITAAALLVGVTANLVFRLKGKARMANCFLAGMMVMVLIATHLALNVFSPVVSSSIIAEAIKPEVDHADIVVVNGPYEDAAALPFYLEQQVKLLDPRPDILAPWSYAPDAPHIFIGDADLATLWTTDTRVFIWTPEASAPHLPGQSYVIARDGGRQILSNQPNNAGASF